MIDTMIKIISWRPVVLSILAISVFFMSASAIAQYRTNTPHPSAFSYFSYTDKNHGIKATIYLPEKGGPWTVQNPVRNASTTVVASPAVYVVAAFQNTTEKRFYGLVRVAPDLDGRDCRTVFEELSELDGLKITSQVTGKVSGTAAQEDVLRFINPDGNLVVTSKLLCNENAGIELFVATPNDQKYVPVINDILQKVYLSIDKR